MEETHDDDTHVSEPVPPPPFVYPINRNLQFMGLATQHFQDLISDDVEMMYLELKQMHVDQEGSSSTPVSNKRKVIDRSREDGDGRLWNDYFAPEPVYPAKYFRRRFRMSRELFFRIVKDLSDNYPFFTQRPDAVGRMGLSPIQKCTSAIRQLAYGYAGDAVDEYVRIGETTANTCLKNFCRHVIELYSKEYLRRPNEDDIQRLLEHHSITHGLPGMLGSIDCMHWPWKNCPVAWKGQYTRGDQGCPTIMLEAVASNDLWIWHAFFGVAGSNNDINVLNQSPIFNDVLDGFAPPCNFTVNGKEYHNGYYLADGIYPEWATLVKSFSFPQDPKMQEFKKRHESARKDVERAFGVLQARWHILQGPTRMWSTKIISDIMYACIILHNMIVEDEGFAVTEWSDDEDDEQPPPNHGPIFDFTERLQRFKDLRNKEAHHALRHDLVEHLWLNKD